MAGKIRVAVVDRELCKPSKCQLLCQRVCPKVRGGEDCIVYDKDTKELLIDEDICIGCGICPKKCPFGAITIVNLPTQLEETPIHRYGNNGFILYRLPFPTSGRVVGIVGPNGVGKTTALHVLSGNLKPNLGNVTKNAQVDISEMIKIFRGTELQAYLENLKDKKVRTSIKPQRVDQLPSMYKGKVKDLLERVDERGIVGELVKEFDVERIVDKELGKLSGGELQRIAIIACLARDAQMYYLDEPTSFLDVFQRMKIAKLIRQHCSDRSVVIVDHDLATLDFLADRTHIFYGAPAVYGIVSKPYGVRAGINIFLDGYIKEDNVRFRPEGIVFSSTMSNRGASPEILVSFSDIKKKLGDFALEVKSGDIRKKEVLAVLGANALGKTTFAKILAGELKADEGEVNGEIEISYKPQYVAEMIDDDGATVREFLNSVRKLDDDFKIELIRPLELERLLEKEIAQLSGGELQRVAIAACLARDADLHLLDEPSAFLDVEQRLEVAKLLNKLVDVKEKAALVIDHDLLFLSQVGDRAMAFLGESAVSGKADGVTAIKSAFNRFLEQVGVTFRRDPQTGRPRANKPDSQMDQEQKGAHDYFRI